MSQSRTGLTKNPKLKINLSDIFDTTMPDSSQLRAAIGQEIIDIIRTKTDANRDKDGKKFFGPYSKEYSESLKFKAFGKSKRDVNMQLTGDMMGLMDIVDESRNTITIGWDSEKQSGKAAGHISGIGSLPRRDFFGLSESDIQKLKDKFKSDIEDARKAEQSFDVAAQSNAAFNIGLELIKKQAAESSSATTVSLPLGTLANVFGDNGEG